MKMQNQDENIEDLLKSIKAPAMFGLIGYGIVLIAFVLAIINFLLPTPSAFIQIILQPFIFVGLANLLYHIGQHVHALHINVIRMGLQGQSQVVENDDA